ncbi:MAG: alanine:cation symporter family protein, partial [Phycisphaerae bacterium]
AVGTVESVADGKITVRCADELPQTYDRLYRDKLVDGNALAIQIVRDTHHELKTVTAIVTDLGTSPPATWAQLSTITLDASEMDADALAQVTPGQQVHLDIAGAELTSFAFDTAIYGFGKYIVTLGVCLFAFSTMISWSYYGEKGAEYLFGPGAILPYKFVFVIFVFLGMVLPKFDTVVDFSDATTGLMVLCNLPAILILSPVVIRATRDYFRRLDAGEMKRR